jgi:hypothetical protein
MITAATNPAGRRADHRIRRLSHRALVALNSHDRGVWRMASTYDLPEHGPAPAPATAPPHVHTGSCNGSNELDELCCPHLDGARLMAAVTWHVPVRRTGARTRRIERVFTDTAADARALLIANGYHVLGDPVHVPTADPYTGEVR